MISILLATYNWPQALKLCLESLATQTEQDFEVIIADDGSTESTKQMIDAFKATSPYPITHLWQEDLGFRKTQILNRAIDAAQGDYLIFLDGDCLVQPDFVDRHRLLAQPGYLVTGSRVNAMLGPDAVIEIPVQLGAANLSAVDGVAGL